MSYCLDKIIDMTRMLDRSDFPIGIRGYIESFIIYTDKISSIRNRWMNFYNGIKI